MFTQPVERKIFTVSELNKEIKLILEKTYPFIWVEGEISNFKIAPSGHFYFTLKDKSSQIQAVMFRSQQRSLRFQPQDGAHVICQGRLGVYEQRGVYQIYVDMLEPRGIGALQLAFEQLKNKLASEGLFDPDHKKPFPVVPQKIVLITSPRGAAIRDILRVLDKSILPVETYILPAKVQGDGASSELSLAVEEANRLADTYRFDLIIIGRGGGSLEDLWAFNDESLARTIFRSQVPVISAVGHEIDFTIADFVADFRAPTPTAAAEMVVKQLEKTEYFFIDIFRRMRLQMQNICKLKHQEFSVAAKSVSDPRRLLSNWRLSLDEQSNRMLRAFNHRIEGHRKEFAELKSKMNLHHPGNLVQKMKQDFVRLRRESAIFYQQYLLGKRKDLDEKENHINALNPLAVLRRGYSVTSKKCNGRILKSVDQVQKGDELETRLHIGKVDSTVLAAKK